MQMALEANEIDEMALPEMTASYVVHMNPDLEVCCAAHSHIPMSLAFGFMEKSRPLLEKFNKAIRDMELDFTLANLQGEYINNSDNYTPVKFARFPGADTIRVAVTGDLPPVDFVAPDGNPAGYNTALLAEIGRRIKANIEIIHVEAGSRTVALTSGRADVAFWYETTQISDIKLDAPDGVLLSEPYYSWNTFLHIRKKLRR